MLIDIEKIEVGERLRSRLDPQKLRQLADDMERNGQLQEIVVVIKWGTNNRGTTVVEQATLIAGYRRLEAAKMLGWTQIRCTRQLDGDIDPESEVDLLRIEYSENELRENFTEMERIAFGVKVKERIAAAARERMLAGKKPEYEYDPETGYKVWNDEGEEATFDNVGSPTTNPVQNFAQGMPETERYKGGKVNEFAARKIGMNRETFRQGEYVLKHGTEEQLAAIDRGQASIYGTYNELKPNSSKSAPIPAHREHPTTPTAENFTLKGTSEIEPTKSEPLKPTKFSEKAKEERATVALSPEEREAVERNNAFAAMTPEEKISELQSQLKAERCRAITAETELSRLKDELHNAVYHRDGIISSLERQLEAARTRINELEGLTHETH